MTVKLAREKALFVGISAGANVSAVSRLANIKENAVIVTILCDGKYLSGNFWNGHKSNSRISIKFYLFFENLIGF